MKSPDPGQGPPNRRFLAAIPLALILLFVMLGMFGAAAHEGPATDAYVFWRTGCPFSRTGPRACRRSPSDSSRIVACRARIPRAASIRNSDSGDLPSRNSLSLAGFTTSPSIGSAASNP